MPRKRNVKGFTLIELMVVIAILFALAAIALPHLMSYLKQSRDASSKTGAKNAYIAAQAYFHDHPDGSISSTDTLINFGFRQTRDVNVSVSGSQYDLVITAYHSSGDKTYTIDHEGNIQ
jgi:type IV pilus assembly protein PilA